jgi:hypothetical protein
LGADQQHRKPGSQAVPDFAKHMLPVRRAHGADR